MQIAICISNKETCFHLKVLLENYQKKQDTIFFCHFYHNTTDFLSEFKGGKYDAIFFCFTNSEPFVQEIYQKDKQVRLICIADIDNLSNKFTDKLWYCLPKPLGATFLFPLLDRLYADIKKSNDAGLVIKDRGSVLYLIFSKIEYVEVIGKTLFFHLNNDKIVDTLGSLSDLESKLLHLPDFIKVHRSYIVNLCYIEKLESGCILTRNGYTIPVSRAIYPQLKKDWLCKLMDPSISSSLKTAPDVPPITDCVTEIPSTIFPKQQLYYTILLVDDEKEQLNYWSKLLIEKGYQIKTAQTIETALDIAQTISIDCILLDVNLGSACGFDFATTLSNKTAAPIIFLSVVTDEESQMQGFLSGGIDYITKDINKELFWLKVETRIKAASSTRAELHSGSLFLDLKNRKTFCHQKEVFLTLSEFDLLCVFVQNPDTIYTPEQLYTIVWGKEQWNNGQAILLHISSLCRKLENVYPKHHFIQTVWGKGYRFIAEPLQEGE